MSLHDASHSRRCSMVRAAGVRVVNGSMQCRMPRMQNHQQLTSYLLATEVRRLALAHSEAAFAYDVVRWESLAELDGEECEETAATMRRIDIIFIMRRFMSFKNFSGVVRAPVVHVYVF